MEHQKIIKAFKQSPNDGLIKLFEEYGKQLYGYALAQFKLNEDQGYEVLYKTLHAVSIFINKYDFKSGEHFKNWLFKIHKNNVLQALRSQKRKENLVEKYSYDNWVKEINDVAADEGDEPFDTADYQYEIKQISTTNPYKDEPRSNELMVAMQRALLELNETERDLLLLRANNFTYDEIEELLKVKDAHLKVKHHRAKAKLKKKTLIILKEANNEK